MSTEHSATHHRMMKVCYGVTVCGVGIRDDLLTGAAHHPIASQSMFSNNSVTLVGRASKLDTAQLKRLRLGLEECPPDDRPAVTWQIIVWDADLAADCTINLRASDAPVLEQICRMSEGHPIRVTVELPPPSSWPASCKKIAECTTANGTTATYAWRLDSPDVELTVTRLELLGKPVQPQEVTP